MTLALEETRKLIRATRAEADRIGKAMAICIVDAGGYIISIDRMKGARPLTPSIAISKAYSAAVMERPTLKLKGLAESEPTLFAQMGRMGHQPVVAAPGGYPIVRDGQVIGGIGTSGGNGMEDEDVARNALKELGYKIDF